MVNEQEQNMKNALSATSPAAVLEMLNEHQVTLNTVWEYKHIPPFTLNEVADFLACKPGIFVNESLHYTRSSQVRQAVSAIGAFVIDRKLATDHTFTTYKALWEIELSEKCQYCKKPFTFALMMGASTVCMKFSCRQKHMRDSM